MTYRFLIWLSIFYPSLLLSQEIKTQSKDSIVFITVPINYYCEQGSKQALDDFDDGQYNLYSYGLVFYQDYEFTKFFENYAKEKYSLVIKNMGCVITEYNECYSHVMDSLVYRKFGDDIVKKIKEEAKVAYKKK